MVSPTVRKTRRTEKRCSSARSLLFVLKPIRHGGCVKTSTRLSGLPSLSHLYLIHRGMSGMRDQRSCWPVFRTKRLPGVFRTIRPVKLVKLENCCSQPTKEQLSPHQSPTNLYSTSAVPKCHPTTSTQQREIVVASRPAVTLHPQVSRELWSDLTRTYAPTTCI